MLPPLAAACALGWRRMPSRRAAAGAPSPWCTPSSSWPAPGTGGPPPCRLAGWEVTREADGQGVSVRAARNWGWQLRQPTSRGTRLALCHASWRSCGCEAGCHSRCGPARGAGSTDSSCTSPLGTPGWRRRCGCLASGCRHALDAGHVDAAGELHQGRLLRVVLVAKQLETVNPVLVRRTRRPQDCAVPRAHVLRGATAGQRGQPAARRGRGAPGRLCRPGRRRRCRRRTPSPPSPAPPAAGSCGALTPGPTWETSRRRCCAVRWWTTRGLPEAAKGLLRVARVWTRHRM